MFNLGAGGNIVLNTPSDGSLAADAIELGGVHDGFTPLLRRLDYHELPKSLMPHTTANVIRGLAIAACQTHQLEHPPISAEEAEAALSALGMGAEWRNRPLAQLASMTVREAQEALATNA